MQNRILSLLGIAAKAGRLQSGEFASEKAIKSGNAFLVVIAADASENTKKHYTDMCSYRDIPLYTYGTKEELGRCTGKESRAVIALTDEGLGNSLISVLKEESK
ncbi:MAG: 50S ribosomal protein L7ae [Lachnospiraceae bacterium]|nr:50S ribosomal protein L7ae [Lachnospiraceae bacterium]